MKKILILALAALTAIGCNSAAQTTVNANLPIQKPNTNQQIHMPNDLPVVSSHSNSQSVSLPNQPGQPGQPAQGSPMSKPVDVTEMTADIEKAANEFKKNPKDEKAKGELAKAYFVRATALTGAAQYRAALGDYRKGLKLNPNDEEAKAMHDQIISIFQSIGREPPKDGEEPPPMPIK